MRKTFAARRAVVGSSWFFRQMQSAAAEREATNVGHGPRVHRCRECGGRVKLGAVCRVCHVELVHAKEAI